MTSVVSSTSSTARAVWRYHPVGAAATAARCAGRIAWALVAGGVVTLFLTMVPALVVEEGLVDDAQVATTIDLVGRATWGVALVALPSLALVALLLDALGSVLVARALARLDDDAASTGVPAPAQWSAASGASSANLARTSVVMAGFVGFFAVAMLVYVIFEGESGLWVSILVLLLMTSVLLGVAAMGRWLLPRLRAEQMSVAGQRWPQAARVAASGRDLGKHGPDEASLADRLPGAGLRRAAWVAAAVAVLSVQGVFSCFLLVVAIAYPDAERWPGGRAGERADLTERGERLVDGVVGVLGGLGALAAVAGVVWVVCEVLARRSEVAAARKAVRMVGGPQPPLRLVARVLREHSPLTLGIGGLLGGAMLVGLGVYVVGMLADDPDWSYYATAGAGLRAAGESGLRLALGGALGTILLVAVSTVAELRLRGVRDELVQRWPVQAEGGWTRR